jgi:hypothetical protein
VLIRFELSGSIVDDNKGRLLSGGLYDEGSLDEDL